MNKRLITILLIIAIILVALLIIISWTLALSRDNIPKTDIGDDACIKLGCDENTMFVGSREGDVFYECDCRYAKQINPENVVCFASAEEALMQIRTKSEC